MGWGWGGDEMRMEMTQVFFFIYNSEGGKHFVFSLVKVCIHLNFSFYIIDSLFFSHLHL